jgi:hypothetical protein
LFAAMQRADSTIKTGTTFFIGNCLLTFPVSSGGTFAHQVSPDRLLDFIVSIPELSRGRKHLVCGCPFFRQGGKTAD